MKGKYWQPGEVIDYTNGTENKIEANTVVTLGGRIGVTGTDIEAGALGTVITEGVFEFEKTDSTEAVTLGAAVYFDGEGVTTSAQTGSGNDATDNTPAGWAVKASAANVETVFVKIG